MAPEMIKNQQHDHSLDVWCLGIFLYELIHGYAPFKGKNDQEKCRSIISKAKIPFENQISPLAIDLIEGILKINPKERMSLEGRRIASKGYDRPQRIAILSLF